MMTYKIVRFYRDQPFLNGETVATGLTLDEARHRCADPETSSSTATGAKAALRTQMFGPWFEGYEEVDADHSASDARLRAGVDAAMSLLEGT